MNRTSLWSRTSAPQCWVALAVIFLMLDAGLFSLFTFGADWGPLWVAGKLAWIDPARSYDFDLVTSLQTPLLGQVDDRPFIYPPSVLLLAAPLALLPFSLSLAFLSLLSVASLAMASRAFGSDRIMLLIAPPVVLCAMAGQLSLLVGALAMAAITRLGSKDMTAGVLLGLAIAIKPTLFILVPIALICGGHWRALIASGLSAGALTLMSVALFGLELWFQWLLALPRFQQLFLAEPTLVSSAITPYATATRLGLDPRLAMAVGILIAVPLAAYMFARSHDPAARLIVLLGGALLVTPYAMNYELALLAPALLGAELSSPKRLVLPTLWAASLCSGASVLGLAAGYSWAVARVWRPTSSSSDEGRVQPWVHIRA